MPNDLFEIATRKKYRFPFNGQISVEDLWDLSSAQLDRVYKELMKDKKNCAEDSLLSSAMPVSSDLNNRIELVRFIFDAKQAELAETISKMEREHQQNLIREIIADKKNAQLKELPIEELEKLLKDD